MKVPRFNYEREGGKSNSKASTSHFHGMFFPFMYDGWEIMLYLSCNGDVTARERGARRILFSEEVPSKDFNDITSAYQYTLLCR